MMAANISTYFCPTRLYFGAGSHEKISEIVRSRGYDRAFVILDAALAGTEFYARVGALLAREGVAVTTFTQTESDPSATTVHLAFEAYRANEAALLIAIGGGSTMDVAKAVRILAANGGQISDYEGTDKFASAPLPLIAVPTTAGTGSEVSGSCVITDTEKHRKMSIRHAALNPASVAILDPLALRTVPSHVATHSGMDAFVHAFESYISREANLITDAINLQAIELLSANIRIFVANREDADAALNMLCGSTLAGMTFGQTGLGNVHCMARFVGAYFNLSHGLSNALCLPHVAKFNLPADPFKFARVAAAMGRSVQGLPTLDAAQHAVEAIDALCDDLNIPRRLRDVGATEDKFDEMAELCTQANYNRWNPRHTTTADFRALLQQAF